MNTTDIEPQRTQPSPASDGRRGRFSLRVTNRDVVTFVAAALLVALVVPASFWAFGQLDAAAAARRHTYDLIVRANALLSSLIDAETAQRNYALSGDEAFLQPYLAVRDGAAGQLQALRRLTQVSAAQKSLDALAPLVDAKLAEMARVVELRRGAAVTAVPAAESRAQERQSMDSIRAEMASFLETEEGLLAQNDAAYLELYGACARRGIIA